MLVRPRRRREGPPRGFRARPLGLSAGGRCDAALFEALPESVVSSFPGTGKPFGRAGLPQPRRAAHSAAMGTDAASVLRQAADWLEEGHGVALATVLSTWGSAPRRPGSHMAICDSGAFVGSVSGGCVEAAVIEASRQVLDGGDATVLEYGVSNDDAWAVGLACGGRVKIRLERIG